MYLFYFTADITISIDIYVYIYLNKLHLETKFVLQEKTNTHVKKIMIMYK